MPPHVLAENGEWMLEMRMLRAETPADGISAAGKYWTSTSPGSFHIRVYPIPRCTRNGPDVASWHQADMPQQSLHVRYRGRTSLFGCIVESTRMTQRGVDSFLNEVLGLERSKLFQGGLRLTELDFAA